MKENEFDFGNVGKRTPYTVPNGFFDTMERNIMSEVAKEPISASQTVRSARPKRLFRIPKQALLAAAAVAVVVLTMTFRNFFRADREADYADVETAFGNLSVEDQAYLVAVYADDVFYDEQ